MSKILLIYMDPVPRKQLCLFLSVTLRVEETYQLI